VTEATRRGFTVHKKRRPRDIISISADRKNIRSALFQRHHASRKRSTIVIFNQRRSAFDIALDEFVSNGTTIKRHRQARPSRNPPRQN